MNSAILCLDVGGTELKGAAVSPQGALLAPIRHFPANAQASREALLEHLKQDLPQSPPISPQSLPLWLRSMPRRLRRPMPKSWP